MSSNYPSFEEQVLKELEDLKRQLADQHEELMEWLRRSEGGNG